MTATEQLLEAARLQESHFEGERTVIPSMHVAVVTCMDSRINLFRIFGLDSGQAHVIRNAGGLVTDDVLRSLVLSQRLLQTREVIVMHHTDCGLHGADDAALREQIIAETGEAPPYAFGAFHDLEAAVQQATERVRTHRFLPHRDHVRGFIYDVRTGRVRAATS